jgi:hypothetical protein
MGPAALMLFVLFLSVASRVLLVLAGRGGGLDWRLRDLGLDVVDGHFVEMMTGGGWMIGLLSRMLC